MNNEASTDAAAPSTADLSAKAQDLAGNLVQSAKDKVLDLAEDQKAAVAEQAAGVARMLDNVAEEIEQGIPAAAPYLREGASGVHRLSSLIRERGAEDFLQDLSGFARRRPATFVGACVIGGFALARFLKSSADRRASTRRRTPDQGSSARSVRSETDTGGNTRARAASMASATSHEPPRAARGDSLSSGSGTASNLSGISDTAATGHPSAAPAGGSNARGSAAASMQSSVRSE